MRTIPSMLLALAMTQTASAAGQINVEAKQIAPDQFELTAQLPVGVDPQQASSLLQPVAQRVCGDRSAQLGRYRFESQAPLAAGSKDEGTQVFKQLVECGGTAAVAIGIPAPETQPTPEDERSVRDNTLTYLAAKDGGDFDRARALMDEETASMMRPENWQEPRTAFNKDAGLPLRREVVRITWYDNPAGAPRPGRYAAADYRGDYAHPGFYCGYVVWYLEPDDTYRIVREEEGQMSEQVAKKLAPSELASARAQIGCRD